MKTIEQYKGEIEKLKAQIPVAEQACRDHPYMYSGDFETRCANMKARRKLEADVSSLRSRISYRIKLIYKMENPEEHIVLKDVFGQEFKVGNRVAWSPSSRYSGARLGWVVKITPKKVSVAHTYKTDEPFDPNAYGTSLQPKSLIIVDAIVESLTQEARCDVVWS